MGYTPSIQGKAGIVTATLYRIRATVYLWLNAHPDNRIEIITNSVLTSDNFMAQSDIDMEMGPRLLLTPELQG
jgi:hypothetical protein